MNAATEFDLGPLTWVKGEIDLALQRAAEALVQFRSSGDQTQFKFCRTHVHQVCGALSIVGLDGATLLTESLESLLLLLENGSVEVSAEAVDAASQAMDALRHYLDDLLAGQPNQPLRLLPAYQALGAKQGKVVQPAELFYPDLSVRIPKREDAPSVTQREYLAEIKLARMRFQRGMLQWMKAPTEAAVGLEQMREAVAAVEAMQLTSSERTFWWVLDALMEALADPVIAKQPRVRQLCTAVDGQMKRLLEGSKAIPEKLQREALYYLAYADGSKSSVVADVQAAYGLLAMVPRQAAEVTPPQDIALRKLHEILASAEEAWNKFCNGNTGSLQGFVDCARLTGKLTAEIGHTDLKRLGQGFAAIANWLLEDAKRFNDGVAMEVATSILLLANAQENFSHLGSDFAQQVDLMIARLHGQITGKAVVGEKVPLLDEMTRRAQERLLVGQVAREIQKNLGQVEQALDNFFRDTASASELGQLEGQLRQIAGALAMLGHFSAVNYLKDCSTKIQEFSKPGYAPNRADFEFVADRLSMLGFFVDALIGGDADFDAFVKQVENKGQQAAPAVEVEEEAVFAPEPEMAAEEVQQPAPAAAFVTAPVSTPTTFALDFDAPAITPQPATEQLVEPVNEPVKISEQVIEDVLAEMTLPDISPLEEPAASPIAAPAPVVVEQQQQEIDAELLSIFLEEAKEVLQTINEQRNYLVSNPHNVDALTTVRRSTHTLKGSGRMVGLTDLGEAAWELEQTLNQWLRQDLPASAELLELVNGEYELFGEWVNQLESGTGVAPNPYDLVNLARKIRGVDPLPPPVQAVVAVAETAAVDVVPEVTAEETLESPVELPEQQVDLIPEAPVSLDSLIAEPEPMLVAPEAPVEVAAVEEFTLSEPAEVEAFSFELTPASEPAVQEPALAESSLDADFGELPSLTLTEVSSEVMSDVALPAEAENEPTYEGILLGAEESPEATAESLSFETLPEPEPEPEPEPLVQELLALPVTAEEEALLSFDSDLEGAALTFDEAPVVPQDAAIDAAAGDLIAEVVEPVTEDLGLTFSVSAEPEMVLEEVQVEPMPEVPVPAPVAPPVTQPVTLYDIFREEAKGYLQTLLRSDAQLTAEPSTPTSFEMTRAAHTLGGISATVGLLPISKLAVALEHALLRRQSANNPESIEGLAILHQAIVTLEQMFADLTLQRAPEEQPVLVAALEDVFAHVAPSLQVMGGEEEVLEAPLLTEALPEELAPLAEAQPEEVVEAVAAVAAAAAVAEQADSVLPRLKDEFDDQLLPIFLEEAADLLRDLTTQLRTWRNDPTEKSVAHGIGRVLHTFKGSARMAGAMNLGELTHLLETRVEEAMRAGAANGSLVDEIENGCDILVQSVDRLRDGDFSPISPVLPSAAVPVEAAEPGVVPTPAQVIATEAAAQRAEAEREQESAAQKAVLRVRADLVDRLVNEAGELSIARTRIEGEMRSLKSSLLFLTENVIRLRNQLREIEIQAESQIQAKVAQTAEVDGQFDPLELDRFTRFQELTRFMAESVNDVATVQQNLLKNLDDANAAILAQARLNRSLQQELMGVRMVPFASQTERLYRIVRQTAKDVGKRATLDIVGGQVDIDRSVLDKMLAPIEHMLRNAITHGIESRDERLAAGKKEVGEITVKLSQEGNEFILSMSDDGRGLIAERIRARAEANGLLEPGAEVDQNTLFGFIFQPGFSTASELTQVSGRGIGMDVVKTEVAALGGRIEILSQPNQGTTFRLYLPLTLAVTQTLLVRASTQRYALPSTMIEQVLELREQELTEVREQSYVEWKGNRYPFHFLPHLLGEQQAAPEAHRQYWVLLLRSGTQRVAVLVDELQGNQEVVVKNIGAQLARVVGIAGATVLGDGGVVLILNPVALASRAPVVNIDAPAVAMPLTPVEVKEVHLPTVMVVDDSLTVRKITSRLLTREGYTVILAKDGVDALEQLIDARPDVILSDIEMPRMDGFDFVRNLRGDDKLRKIPVIMITSRTADKHRNYALEIGANHYLGKPYDEDELLGYIATYCKKAS